MAGSGKRRDAIVHQLEPLNLEPAPAALAASAITPLDTFYVRSHGPFPDDRPDGWRVVVGGLVERELDLSLDTLHGRFTPREVVATLCCAGNRRADLAELAEIPGETVWGAGAIGTARWGGVRLHDVLETTGVRDGAAHVALLGAENAVEAEPTQPFGASIPLAKASSEEVLLAWEMNGEPLRREHGGPLRVVVPGYTGARSVKWLTRVTVQADPSDNYFQSRSYRIFPADADPETAPAELGLPLNELSVNSAILTPRRDARLPSGPTEVVGYAIAGAGRHVARVDVSPDGGRSWRQARFLDDLGPWAWRRWRAELDLTVGTHEITARAWDSAAIQQVEHAASAWNPKGYANNAWPRVRVHVA
jgi:sulfite oxidase